MLYRLALASHPRVRESMGRPETKKAASLVRKHRMDRSDETNYRGLQQERKMRTIALNNSSWGSGSSRKDANNRPK